MNGEDLVNFTCFLTFLMAVGLSVWMLGGMHGAVESDRPNWGTIVTLDLPVNVTRIIQQDDTTFIYQTRGDEEYLLFTGGNQSQLVTRPAGSVGQVYPYERLKRAGSPIQPSVSMIVGRNNGAVETYALRTRGE